jgi:putative sporulation protein YyaC
VHMDTPEADKHLADAVYSCALPHARAADEIILLCIGTDRSTGDALGPLVGSRLTEELPKGYMVLGTLDCPVHAGNLAETVAWIEGSYRDPLVIAVDASLGRMESVGMLTVGQGSLKPGAGVNKTLPAVGRVYVTGVVNVGGFMEYLVLQNTRLSFVFRMARVAAQGIARGVTALAECRSGAGSLPESMSSLP